MSPIRKRLRRLLFPTKCVICDGFIDGEREKICPSCFADLPWAAQDRMLGDFHEGVVSCLMYGRGIRDSFLRFKFSGQHWLGEIFGQLLSETVLNELGGTFDLITWVPIGRKRLKKRRYDQARLLAEVVGNRLGVETIEGLIKVVDTKANSSLRGVEARRENVADTYESLPGIECRRILLIDDIYTTGATLSECSKTLMLGGADSVVCATLIRAK